MNPRTAVTLLQGSSSLLVGNFALANICSWSRAT